MFTGYSRRASRSAVVFPRVCCVVGTVGLVLVMAILTDASQTQVSDSGETARIVPTAASDSQQARAEQQSAGEQQPALQAEAAAPQADSPPDSPTPASQPWQPSAPSEGATEASADEQPQPAQPSESAEAQVPAPTVPGKPMELPPEPPVPVAPLGPLQMPTPLGLPEPAPAEMPAERPPAIATEQDQPSAAASAPSAAPLPAEPAPAAGLPDQPAAPVAVVPEAAAAPEPAAAAEPTMAPPAEAEAAAEPVAPAEAAPEPTAGIAVVGQDGEPRIMFNCKYQPWEAVLEWFAEQAGFSLVMEGPPHGTFNYSDDNRYTPAEAIDLLNSILLTKGYTLVRRERMLMLVDLEDGVPANLVSIVPLQDLDKRGEYELVSCLFQLERLTSDEAAQEIGALVGPQGSVTKLPKAQQILVTSTAGRLRMIRDMLQRADNPSGGSGGLVQVFPLQYVMPDEVMEILRRLLDIPENGYATSDGSLRVALDRLGMRLFVSGTSAKMGQVSEIIKAIDIPGQGQYTSTATDVPPQFEVYSTAPADADTALQVMQTLLAGTPGVRLAIDPKTGNLVAMARPAEHATIRATLEQLRREATRVEVIRLRRVNPEQAATAIKALLGADQASASTRVEVDAANRQLLVRASEAELQRIRTLLEQMGETDLGLGGGSDERVRVLPLYGPVAERALQQLEQIWPAMRSNPNPIRVVTPAASIPSVRPGASSGAADYPHGPTSYPTQGPQANRVLPIRPLGRVAVPTDGAMPPSVPEQGTSPGWGEAVVPIPWYWEPAPPAGGPMPIPADAQSPGQVVPGPVEGTSPVEPPMPIPPFIPQDGSPGVPPGGEPAVVPSGVPDSTPQVHPTESSPDPVRPAAPAPRVARGRSLSQSSRLILVSSAAVQEGAADASQGSAAPSPQVAQPASSAPATGQPPVAGTEAPPVAGGPGQQPADRPKLHEPRDPPPIVIAPGPNGVMIVSEDTEALDAVEDLLYTLSGGAGANAPQMTIYYLKYATADTVATTLRQILSNTSSSTPSFGGGVPPTMPGSRGSSSSATTTPTTPSSASTVYITPEPRLNALFVHAAPAELDTIDRLLRILDQPESPEEVAAQAKPRLIPVYNAQAEELAEVVRQVYQDRLVSGSGQRGSQGRMPSSPQEFFQMMAAARGGQFPGQSRGGTVQNVQQLAIGVDSRTNSIVVSAPEPLFQEVKSLVEELDRAAATEMTETTQVVSVRHVNPEVVQQVIGTLMNGSSSQRRSSSTSTSTPSSSSFGSPGGFSPFGFRPPFGGFGSSGGFSPFGYRSSSSSTQGGSSRSPFSSRSSYSSSRSSSRR